MYNLRYHIASLVAVFLALTVGLVLGTVVAERGTVTDQSAQIVQDLQKEFKLLRDDNSDLSDSLARDNSFATAMVPQLVGDKLAGKNVLVLSNTGRNDGLSDTVDTIKQAGGVPVVVTLESQSMGLDKIDRAVLVTALKNSGTDVSKFTDKTDLEPLVAAALSHEWTTASDQRPVAALLESKGSISVESLTGTATVQAAALLSAWDDSPDAVALDVAKEMAQAGLPAVGVQVISRDTGVVTAAVSAGMSAVDNVSAPQGEYSLVWLLSGQATGYYGQDSAASALFPSFSAKK